MRKGRATINMLSPVNNIFGTHEGRTGPVLMFLGIAVAPFLLWVFYLMLLVPFKYVVIFEVLWAGRWAMVILGKEKVKLKQYRESKKNAYAAANKLTNISHCHENGLVEYQNGKLAVIVAGYPATYFSDAVFEADLEKFIQALDRWLPDIYLQQVYNEDMLQTNSESLRIYQNKEFMKERMELYEYNDEYASKSTKLYRYVFKLYIPKYEWKTATEQIAAICSGTTGKVFNRIFIADKQGVSDVASRDLGTFIDLDEMLRNKYINEDFGDSSVLFYGDEVPEKYQPHRESADMEERRIVFEEDKGESE